MLDYEYFYDQYRRVPRNSVTAQRDLIDFNSTVSPSTHEICIKAIKRPVTATYIDGTALLGLDERPYSAKDLFPKSKGRRKPSTPCEKKINTGDTFMSLVPAEKTILDTATVRSEKTRSPLSMATATQSSTLPDVQRRTGDFRSSRIFSATVFDDQTSDTKFYGRCATTNANGGWVRRYKSINQSQTLTDLLRDQASKEKVLLRKRTRQQLFLLSSPSSSSIASSWIQRRRAKC